jgi:lysophospholipase L1-like esterase
MITTLLMTATLLLGLAIPVSAETTTVSSEASIATKYVALGDSLTLGFEPDMDKTVMPYGFVDRLYEQSLFHGSATMVNYGLGGLSSNGLKLMLQAVASGKKVTTADIQPGLPDFRADEMLANHAKIKQDLTEATLITLTVGGNDLGTDLVRNFLNNSMTNEQLQVLASDKLKQYQDNLSAILTQLYALNPKVQIIVADQYQPYPPLNRDIYDKLNEVSDKFRAALQAAIKPFVEQKHAVQMAPIAAAFVGKEGIHTYIVSKSDIHPKQSGYALIAEVFAKTIWGENKPATRTEGRINVVVGGLVLDTPHLPTLIDNTTFVPLREYTEALGAQVDWNIETQTATIHMNSNVVELTIGSSWMKSNGQYKEIKDIPLYISSADESKTYVPLRLMVEGLGLHVDYIAPSHSAYINL